MTTTLGWKDPEDALFKEENIKTAITETPFTRYRNGKDVTTDDVCKNFRRALSEKIKPQAKTLFVSATPAHFEMELSHSVAQQVIRPT